MDGISRGVSLAVAVLFMDAKRVFLAIALANPDAIYKTVIWNIRARIAAGFARFDFLNERNRRCENRRKRRTRLLLLFFRVTLMLCHRLAVAGGDQVARASVGDRRLVTHLDADDFRISWQVGIDLDVVSARE